MKHACRLRLEVNRLAPREAGNFTSSLPHPFTRCRSIDGRINFASPERVCAICVFFLCFCFEPESVSDSAISEFAKRIGIISVIPLVLAPRDFPDEDRRLYTFNKRMNFSSNRGRRLKVRFQSASDSRDLKIRRFKCSNLVDLWLLLLHPSFRRTIRPVVMRRVFLLR